MSSSRYMKNERNTSPEKRKKTKNVETSLMSGRQGRRRGGKLEKEVVSSLSLQGREENLGVETGNRSMGE